MSNSISDLLKKQKQASSYGDWLQASKLLDEEEHLGEWRAQPESPHYNYQEISSLLQELREARIDRNISKLLYLVRTTFSRNIGNMGDPRLYSHARSGTKCLIEEYISECELVLETIVNEVDKFSENDELEECESDGSISPRVVRNGKDNNGGSKNSYEDVRLKKEKISHYLEMLSQTRKAFGRTALVFSGGSILGFLHAGVTKELSNAKLLPNIISGSSAGSIFASVFCTRREEEFESAWDLLNTPMNIFEQTGYEESLMTHLKRFLTVGTWIDSSHLKELMQKLIGDITFREAFNRTGRVLNVTVSVAGSHDMPRLLNYLTAPNVVIWSAVVCSCSVPFVFAADCIWAKDPKTKNMYPWSNGHFIDGSVDNDMPLGRLTEMFNVNHFVACQVNPHIAPLFKDQPHSELHLSSCNNSNKATEKSIKSNTKPASSTISSTVNVVGAPLGWVSDKLSNSFRFGQSLMVNELVHSLTMMKEAGLGASAATVALNVINQEYWGDINIVPPIRWSDVGHLFKNPTSQQVMDLVHRGQQATWSKIALIRNHCAVELALDKAIFELSSKLVSAVGQEHKQRQIRHVPHRSQTDGRRGRTSGHISPVHWQPTTDLISMRSRSVTSFVRPKNRKKGERSTSIMHTP